MKNLGWLDQAIFYLVSVLTVPQRSLKEFYKFKNTLKQGSGVFFYIYVKIMFYQIFQKKNWKNH